jgi:hypothetical protein
MCHEYYNNPAEYIKNIKTVLRGLWDIKGSAGRENHYGDDIIFPNIEMCLITLAGWFNESPLKKNRNPRCNFLIFGTPWLALYNRKQLRVSLLEHSIYHVMLECSGQQTLNDLHI